ncbi:uncharacterized protein V6R79_014787 [Siganus canaliculatus]
MKIFVAFTCFLAGCLAQAPERCSSPPLLSGGITVASQKGNLFTVSQYEYDAIRERIFIKGAGTIGNTTFTYDSLLLYKEATLYEINSNARSCVKMPLKTDFQPWKVPQSASLLNQVILGASSAAGEGLLSNVWTGNLPDNGGQYIATVTAEGCIPVSALVQTEQYGWVVVSFFNNVVGIENPIELFPPSYCSGTVSQGQPMDFFSAFH